MNIKNRKQQGFTIIEVLIVLAIAGLILLIVFLAVPALQRNARNTGRRDDAGRFGAAVNDFVANRNAQLPTDAQTGTIVTEMGTMNQYVAADRLPTVTGNQGLMAVTSGQPRFRLVTAATCDNVTNDGSTDAGSNRQAVVQYQLETSAPGTMTHICQNI